MITPDELIQEANKLANPEPTIKDSGYILESLLAKIRPVNFKALAFEKAEEMLKRKQVLTIETTLPDGTVDDSKSAELEEKIGRASCRERVERTVDEEAVE